MAYDCKKPQQYAPHGKAHAYLGRFNKPKFLNQGHNSTTLREKVSAGMEAMGKFFNTDKGKIMKEHDARMKAEADARKTPADTRSARDRQIDDAVEKYTK